MRTIQKRDREPAALLSYRKSNAQNLTWESLPAAEKTAVREALLEDQGEVCCYCMKRIDGSDMKVEHYRSRSRYPDEELTWRNLLAACVGGQGGPRHQQTCDTRKGELELSLNPLSKDVARTLKYRPDGTLASSEPELQRELDDCLNLNFGTLREARRQAYDALRAVLRKRLGDDRQWSRAQLQSELSRLQSARPFIPFLGAFEYWLTKLMKARSR